MHINANASIDHTLALTTKPGRVPNHLNAPLAKPAASLTNEGISLVKPAASGPVQAPPPPPPPSPAPPSPQLTLEGLMRSWGQSDSPYDFTGDGTVNVDDLLHFISNWPSPEQTATASPVEPTVTAVSDPAGDLAGAGLSPVANPEVPGANVAVVGVEPDAPADSTAVPPPPAEPAPQDPPANEFTLPELIKAWGQRNSEYDLNGDGTVNVDDLLIWINKMQSNNNAAAANTGGLKGWSLSNEDPASPRAADRSLAGLTRLADTLADRLLAAGFQSQPPSNLHDILDKLDLSPRQSDFMIKQLNKRYPQGLGVNMVG